MPRVPSLGTLFLVVALAAPLKALAGTKDMASAVLEGRRVSYLVCELINKSGGKLSGAVLTLKKPDGNPIGFPFSCPTLAIGETCALEHAIGFPDLDLAAYCHAQLPKVFVRGALRFLDRNRNTLAESDLEADLHGKVAAQGERLDERLVNLLALLAPPLVIAFIDSNNNNVFDDGPGSLIAKLVDADQNGAPSPGDILVPGRYPLDFSASSTGRFRSGPMVCNAIVSPSPNTFACTTATGFLVTLLNESVIEGIVAENLSTNVITMNIADHIGGPNPEPLQVETGSVFDPETNIPLMFQGSPANDTFVDVIKLY